MATGTPGGSFRAQRRSAGAAFHRKLQSYFPSSNISCGTDPALLGHYPQVTEGITGNSPCLPMPQANIKLEGKIQFPKPSKTLRYEPARERAPK